MTIQDRAVPARKTDIDVCKGLLTLLVIFGHCIQYGMGQEYRETGAYFDNYLYRTIYCFHMPAFMIISGYFFASSCQKTASILQMLKRRILSMLIPISSWSVFAVAVGIQRGEVTLSLLSVLKSIVIQWIFSLWFLWAIVFGMLVTCLWKYMLKRSKAGMAIIILLLIITPDSFNLHLYKFTFPFFLIGFLLYERNNILLDCFSIKNRKNAIIFLSAVALLVISVGLYDRSMFVYNTGITILNKEYLKQISIDIVRWLVAAVGCYVFFVLSYYINKILVYLPRGGGIAYLGKNSISFYILSVVVLNKYILIDLQIVGKDFVLLKMGLILAICAVFTSVTQKRKTISCILWGK